MNGRSHTAARATAITALIAALAGSLTACGGSDDDTPPPLPASTQAAVDSIVEQQMAAGHLPSAVVLISIPGEGRMVKAYGKANLTTGTPRNTVDPFRIASITKTFIATLILQLADDGTLALNDKVSKWYPGFPNGDIVTIDLLLRMRSGFVDPLDAAFLTEQIANPTAPLTPQQMIDRAAARGSEFVTPDTLTSYTNLNYVMLGEIAAKSTQKDIRVLLDERIYKPLGLKETAYPVATELGGSTRGYVFDPSTGQSEDLTVLDPSPAGGSGAMISTLADLEPYARALCKGTLLKPATHAQRLQGTTPDGSRGFLKYGAGIQKLGNFCGHNGGILGFSSELFYLPQKDAVIAINIARYDLDDKSHSTELFLRLTKQLFPTDVNW